MVVCRQRAVQKRDREREQVVVPLWSLAAMIQEVGEDKSNVYSHPVWHDIARSSGGVGEKTHSQHRTGRTIIPPRTMRAVQLRYPREVRPGDLFAVGVETTSLLIEESMQDKPQGWVTGWDPPNG